MADYTTLSDAALITLLQNGSYSAFTEIYRRYHHLLLVHALKKLRDEEQAKDVIQDVFTMLWHKKNLGENCTNLAGYLYTTVRNRIFNLFAHQQIVLKHIDSINDYSQYILNIPTDQAIREKELQECIETEIRALPPKMRRIFEMSRKQYLSYTEIADELATTDNNVSKQVNNALKILRVKLSMFFSITL